MAKISGQLRNALVQFRQHRTEYEQSLESASAVLLSGNLNLRIVVSSNTIPALLGRDSPARMSLGSDSRIYITSDFLRSLGDVNQGDYLVKMILLHEIGRVYAGQTAGSSKNNTGEVGDVYTWKSILLDIYANKEKIDACMKAKNKQCSNWPSRNWPFRWPGVECTLAA